jgi:hypothetical protein
MSTSTAAHVSVDAMSRQGRASQEVGHCLPCGMQSAVENAAGDTDSSLRGGGWAAGDTAGAHVMADGAVTDLSPLPSASGNSKVGQ